jgi:long chain fatty acid CoA FadD26
MAPMMAGSSLSSLPALLGDRASRRPDATAYTFIDYEADPSGFAESLTWAEVHRRALNVAEELRLCGSVGDRAAILAPQGLDYIVAFLGALQAGFIAVPLPVPQFGAFDERVSSALRDCKPAVVLTTSSAVDDVTKYTKCLGEGNGRSRISVVEVDLLDLDSARELDPMCYSHPGTAYLQYTSGSTGDPAGVVVSHGNVIANLEQAFADYFGDAATSLSGLTLLSWLPFYHDMGLILALCAPMKVDATSVLLSPMSFLQRPARWMRLLAENPRSVSFAPNFAFELAVRRTSDDQMAGLDLGDVLFIGNGSERVHARTIKRFSEHFARFNLKETVIRPSYGLAEATVYVASGDCGCPPKSVRFDYEKLSNGHAKPCGGKAVGAAELVGHGTSHSVTLRIVHPETRAENPAGMVGEIWVHGENVANGYWQKPRETERVFGGRLVNPSPGTPEGPWLRTGDLGVISDGELFIIGRIKDLLVVDGSNHYPDDIEATIQEITGGRAAAISIPNDRAEQLVAIAEIKKKLGYSDEEHLEKLRSIKHQVTSAISNSHRLRLVDLVFVAPGSLPITTSGKIRRSACAERYRQDEFERLDARA